MYGTANLQHAKDLLPLQAAFEAAPLEVKPIVGIARFFARRGMFPGAITYMRQALGIQPDNPIFHREMGKYYNQVARHDDALYHIRRAVALDPRDTEARRLLGAALCSVKQFNAGVRILSEASELPGRRDLTLCMLAKACYDNGDFDASVKYAEQAVAIRNGSASQGRQMLTNGYAQIGSFDKAIYHATKIAKSKPSQGLPLLVNILGSANMVERAVETCRRALKLQPNNPSLHFSHAWSLLMLGDYEKGWEEYEWRLRSNPNHLDAGKFRAPLTQAMWAGENPSGKTILVHGEQGFGDNIQFIRYVQSLLNLGAKVIVLAPAPLTSLFSRIPGIVNCGSYMEMMPRYDFHVVAGSLPSRFTRHIREIPSTTPYLTAPDRPASFFRVKRKKSLNAGICWGGNKLAPTDRRAIDIDIFASLFSLKGVDFYSLQVGPKSEEITPYLSAHVFDSPTTINDFADTAAILERLDLLVTVDSGIAHLAGALARKVFTLLPFAADWRWLKNDPKSQYYEVTPWYPTMRLFRQPRFGDWESVFKKLVLALSKEVKLKHSSKDSRKLVDANG